MPELGKATYELVFDTTQVAKMDAAEAKVAAATDGISTSTAEAEAAIGRLSAAAGVAGSEVTTGFAEAGAGAQAGAAEITAASGAAAAGAEAGAAKTAMAWEKANSRVAKISKTMMHKITLPVAAVVGVGVKQFLDYSQKIKLLSTQAGASAGEMNHMRIAILKMDSSGQSIHGPKALADAMYHIESAGIRGSEALKVLKTASDGAMVGNAGLEETTYALVSAFESQAKGTKTIGEAMANVNAIIGAGDMRLEDLTGALSTGIIPAAKGAGLGIRDIGAALDTMTSRGMPAQQAATRLGMTIAMMQKPTTAASKALASIGIGQLDLARIMRAKGLPAALDFLRAKLQMVNDPAKRAAIVLQAFGGGRTGKAMLLLLQNLDDVHKRMVQINREGSPTKYQGNVVAAQAEAVNKLKTAWAQLQVALVQLGAAATPTVIKLAHGAIAIMHAWQKLPGPVKKVLGALILLVAIGAPVVLMFAKVFKAIMILGRGVTIIKGVRIAMLGLETETAASTAIVALAALGWVAFAAAGVAAIYEIVKHMPLLGGAVSQFGGWIGGKIANAAGVGAGDAAKNAAATAAGNQGSTMVFKVRARYAWLTGSGMSRKDALAAMAKDPQFASLDAHSLDIYSKGHNPAGGATTTDTKTPATKKKDSLFGKLGLNDNLNPAKAKKTKSTGLLPLDLQIAEAVSQRQGVPAQLAVLVKERTYLTNLLKSTKSKTKILEIQQALSGIYSTMQGLDGTKTGTSGSSLLPQKMQLAEAQAQRKGPKALEKVLQGEEKYLRDVLKHYTGSMKKRIAIEKELDSVIKKLTAVHKKIKNDITTSKQKFDLEMQAFVDTRGSFFSEFASSVFHTGSGGLEMGAGGDSKTMNYSQNNHFNEVPKDRFALGRQMARSAAAAF